MARIKKHQNTRNQEMKHRRRKPNIPELVYKFLVANEAFDDTNSRLVNICRYCDQKKRHDEVMDSSQIIDRSTSYKIRQEGRKDSDKISKLHNIKRCHVSKDLPISYLQHCVNDEDARKATRKYMTKALDFGVESGYLIPSDTTYKILRVSSDLMKSDSPRSEINKICNMALSKNRNISTRLDELQVQEQGKRRKRRRSNRKSRRDSRMRRKSRSRSRGRGRRSRSRSRGRRRYSPQNPEEVAEDEAGDYEMDKNDPKSNIHTHDDIEREPKTVRSNQSDEEQSTKKADEGSSDLSIDEDDETDDENEKKRTNITKS